RRKLAGVVGLDAAFFDFDNDGRLDLVVVGKGGVRLFRNDATRGFEDVSSILPDSLRAGRAVAVADIDQDGDLDLIVVGWDGRGFTFATDAMWNSALGMPLGIMTREGGILSASPHASQEYLRLPAGLLRARDGRYQMRLTEELWETGYLDEARLLAVDHPE